jgi:hypothetical protein
MRGNGRDAPKADVYLPPPADLFRPYWILAGDFETSGGHFSGKVNGVILLRSTYWRQILGHPHRG